MTLESSQGLVEATAGHASLLREKTYSQVITALDQSSDMIVLFDPDDRIVFANRAWRELNADVSHTTVPGTKFEQHIRALTEHGIIPDAIGQEEEWIARRMERHRNPQGPFELRTRNDQWISVDEQLLEDGSTILVIRDNTERIKTEQLIQTQNERFSIALHNIPAGLCVYDKDNRLVVSNANFGKLYGVAPELLKPGITMFEVMKQRIDKGLYAGESPEQYIHDRLKWVARRKPGFKTETLSDGRMIQITQQPLEHGGWLSIHEDVTERVRSQKALEVSERQFRDLVEGSIQGLFISREWKMLFANHALADIFGYENPEELLLVESPLDLFDPCERERIMGFKAAREKGEYAPETYEFQGIRKDGCPIIAELRITRVQWQGEIATQCVIVDITDRKNAEAELIRHRDHLQELVDTATQELKVKADELNEALAKEKSLNEQQKHFISVATHEFRTPLSIIDASVQRLQRRKDSLSADYLESRVRKIRSAIKTMTNLMESTLAAARADAGKVELNIANCHLSRIVTKVCMRQLDLNETHKIICDLNKIPDSIYGDGAALELVFTNLLSNAVKYSPDGPDISVNGWVEGSDILVSVQDRGLGIDASELPKMFSRFFRASTSSGIPGTGIGLNLAKELVELHGGAIKVESAEGKGSTFTVRLPIAGPEATRRDNPDSAAA